MKQFDYGYHGDQSRGTDFWCFVTDILMDDKLVVMTEDGERFLLNQEQFTRLGSLCDYVNSIRINEESRGVGMGRVIYSRSYCFCTSFETSYTAPDLLTGYMQVLQYAHEYAEQNKPLLFHPSPAYLTTYVTLVNAVPTFNGGFTAGHTYYIYRGCLLNEAGECYADKITSVAELNDWDVDACFWKEEKDFEERTSELFQVDQP